MLLRYIPGVRAFNVSLQVSYGALAAALVSHQEGNGVLKL